MCPEIDIHIMYRAPDEKLPCDNTFVEISVALSPFLLVKLALVPDPLSCAVPLEAVAVSQLLHVPFPSAARPPYRV